MKTTFIRRASWTLGRYGVGFSYAEKGGGLVLRGQNSWRKINGIWINTKWWQLWLEFRRHR